MSKVGRFIIDRKGSTYCRIALDGGDRLIVTHDQRGVKGGHLTIEVSKLLGFSSSRIFVCNLDSAEGKSILAQLTHDASPGSVEATPLGALVDYVKSCGSAALVKVRCAALTAAP